MDKHITRKRVTMTVTMDVTVPQALSLQAMFEYWNSLSREGSSRDVAFYVDGDGNFHPKCEISFSEKIPELTDELEKLSIVGEEDGDRRYDFDRVAWHFTEMEERKE